MHRRTDSATTVIRYDRGEMEAPTVTDEGFVIATGTIARAGVLVYMHPDGSTTREYVPPEELAREDSLATLRRKPTTVEHPPSDVNPDNVGDYQVGDVGDDPRFEPDENGGGALRATICVRRRDGIHAIRNLGKIGLSPGYRCRIEQTAGVHPVFGPYDAIQRDRVYNHTAHTDSPRGGPAVRLHVDSAYQILPGEQTMITRAVLLAALAAFGLKDRADSIVPPAPEGKTDDGKVDAEVIKAALDAMVTAYNALGAELAKAKQAPPEETPPEEAAETENTDEAPPEETPKTDARIDPLAYFKARVPLVDLARDVRIDSDKIEKLGNTALRREIVRTLNPDLPKTATDAYVSAYLDVYRASRADSNTPWRDANGDPSGRRTDTDPKPPPTAAYRSGIAEAQREHFERTNR